MGGYFRRAILKEILMMLGESILVFTIGNPSFFIPLVLLWKTHLSRIMKIFRGFEGEEETYRTLKGFKIKILRNFYTGYGDIDFILIGRFGIILLEVKTYRGTVKAKRNSVTYYGVELLEQLEKNEDIFKRKYIFDEKIPIKSLLLIRGKVDGKNKTIIRDAKELRKYLKKKVISNKAATRIYVKLKYS